MTKISILDPRQEFVLQTLSGVKKMSLKALQEEVAGRITDKAELNSVVATLKDSGYVTTDLKGKISITPQGEKEYRAHMKTPRVEEVLATIKAEPLLEAPVDKHPVRKIANHSRENGSKEATETAVAYLNKHPSYAALLMRLRQNSEGLTFKQLKGDKKPYLRIAGKEQMVDVTDKMLHSLEKRELIALRGDTYKLTNGGEAAVALYEERQKKPRGGSPSRRPSDHGRTQKDWQAQIQERSDEPLAASWEIF